MDSFCTMPWSGVEINTDGNLRPCCEFVGSEIVDAENNTPYNISTHSLTDYMQSNELRLIKQKMLNGEYVKECSNCYFNESVGVKSLRQRKNKSIGETAKSVDEFNIKNMDIKLSNLCNQKCVICNPLASSMYAAESAIIEPDKLKNYDQEKFNWYKLKHRWDEIYESTNDLMFLDIYGGEPWLIKKQWELIEFLVKTGRSSNISLNYATNGSAFNDMWFTEYFSKFKHVTILFSADGIKDTFEYNRFPGKWSTFEENLLKAREYKDRGIVDWIGISYTVSNYSVFDIVNSLEFYSDNKIDVYLNLVNDNEYKINCMPDAVKEKLLTYLKNNWHTDFYSLDHVDVSYFEKLLNEPVTESYWWEVFVASTNAKDKYRGNNILDIIPEFKGYV